VVAASEGLHGQGYYVAHVRASLHHGETLTALRCAPCPAPGPSRRRRPMSRTRVA
jgi:hypothetical protein